MSQRRGRTGPKPDGDHERRTLRLIPDVPKPDPVPADKIIDPNYLPLLLTVTEQALLVQTEANRLISEMYHQNKHRHAPEDILKAPPKLVKLLQAQMTYMAKNAIDDRACELTIIVALSLLAFRKAVAAHAPVPDAVHKLAADTGVPPLPTFPDGAQDGAQP